MKKTEKEFYTLSVVCQNCYNDWVETIPFGEDFEEHGYAGVSYTSYGSGTNAVFIKCPKCGSGKVVKKREEKR